MTNITRNNSKKKWKNTTELVEAHFICVYAVRTHVCTLYVFVTHQDDVCAHPGFHAAVHVHSAGFKLLLITTWFCVCLLTFRQYVLRNRAPSDVVESSLCSSWVHIQAQAWSLRAAMDSMQETQNGKLLTKEHLQKQSSFRIMLDYVISGPAICAPVKLTWSPVWKGNRPLIRVLRVLGG